VVFVQILELRMDATLATPGRLVLVVFVVVDNSLPLALLLVCGIGSLQSMLVA
jgi:hypothetical protein